MIEASRELLGAALAKIFGSRNAKLLRKFEPVVAAINLLEPDIAKLSDKELSAKTPYFKKLLADGKTLDDILPEAFACVREAAKRAIGLRHYDVQMLGGMVLHSGKIAEMVTGEGKTLVATSPVYLNALSRKEGEQSGVHVVTTNDFLAKRDSSWMRPVYELLGLTVGCIQSEMEPPERVAEYSCDIVYGQNNEFGFDYLRDNMKMSAEDQAQKNLKFAVVDEVDSILIDEARTPLIISGSAEGESDKYYRANEAVRRLNGAEENNLQPKIEAFIKEGYEKEAAKEAAEEPFDFVFSEKNHTAYLTERGISKCAKFLNIENFYAGKDMGWPHFLENALRAHSIYKKDVEYVVNDGEVMIVDEFTGRILAGRRWSDGLHQAVEAKENLRIKEEQQTYATITFQNFFKLYDKLGGMTGTAMTEAKEFMQIYKLDTLSVPTNRPLRRASFPDVIYGTEKEKFEAIIAEIVEVNRLGRPVLVGTVSIEKSERLAAMLKRRGIPHEVLNAKQHEREAYIISKAGQIGQVMIATNMAGRGIDIKLADFTRAEILDYWRDTGFVPKDFKALSDEKETELALLRHWISYYESHLDENKRTSPDTLATLDHDELTKKLNTLFTEFKIIPFAWGTSVADLGGLHVIGSERHEARRIDNQLRGRSGRQGDPGSSRFFLSLEDDLMRRFASDWVRNFLRRAGIADGQALESGMVSRSIEKAQRRVEEHNYGIRKRVLEYDEVMNEQRTLVYDRRQAVLEGRDLKERVIEMLEDSCAESVAMRIDTTLPQAEWDFYSVVKWAERKFGFNHREKDANGVPRKIKPELKLSVDDIKSSMPQDAEKKLIERVKNLYETREKDFGAEPMRELEQFIQLDVIDKKWKDHLRDMDHLRQGIYLRAHAQKDPKLEYKREGYNLFREMMIAMYEEVSDLVLRVMPFRTDTALEEIESRWSGAEEGHGGLAGAPALGEEAIGAGSQAMEDASNRNQEGFRPVDTIRRTQPKVKPNDPCPCGSGKKYKKCCKNKGG